MRGRLQGGPAEIRRSFQFFDRDGSGSIDLDEFAYGLEKYCGLKFEDQFLRQLMSEFRVSPTSERNFARSFPVLVYELSIRYGQKRPKSAKKL